MSVGHVARAFEAAGLPTIIIAVASLAGRLEPMRPPRLLLTPFLMGRPLGKPNDGEGQLDVLRTGLNLLETAVAAPTVVHYESAAKT